jgi:hypothetical protein
LGAPWRLGRLGDAEESQEEEDDEDGDDDVQHVQDLALLGPFCAQPVQPTKMIHARTVPAGPRPPQSCRRGWGRLAGTSPSHALEAALRGVAQDPVINTQRHAHRATRVEFKATSNATEGEMTISGDGSAANRHEPSRLRADRLTERVTLLGGLSGRY